jgi:glycosyltransferase involved in cell wall biosynthesis
MSSDQFTLSVIIPAWNEGDYLPDTLASLEHAIQSLPNEVACEVIVVDNASSDNTRSIALSRGACVIFEPERRIARVRNAGAEAAKGDGLVFLDADTRIRATHLTAVVAGLRAGLAGGGVPIDFDHLEGALQRAGLRAWNALSRGAHWAAGCFVFARADLHRAVGGFSEAVYAGEEIAYSRALKRLAQHQGRAFRILDIQPVVSSSRKITWFRPWQHAIVLLTFLFFPWAGRFKRLTWFWYHRPHDG